MNNPEDDWKQSRIDSLEESLTFFSNKGKLERESWVVAHFLAGLEISYRKEEIKEAEEPVDIKFREASFQIKELVPENRRRLDEYKEKLEKAKNAEEYSDLSEEYTPGEITFTEIVACCKDYEEKLITSNKYGIRELPQIDLLFYFNSPGTLEIPPENYTYNVSKFRSVSLLSNRYASILFASKNSPRFLFEKSEKVYSHAKN